MVVVYHDIGPMAEGLGYGLISLTQRQLQLEAEAKARKAARKARQRKTLTMGLGAAAGAGLGALAAPALGLGAVQTGSQIIGGQVVPIMGTSTAGYLTGALGGAAVGAQAGGAFAEGDLASGLGAIASPFVAHELRRQGLAEKAADRVARLADLKDLEGFRTGQQMDLEKFRTEQDILRAQEEYSIKNYGMPTAEARRLAMENYQQVAGAGPQAGENIGYVRDLQQLTRMPSSSDLFIPTPPEVSTSPAMGPMPGGPPQLPGGGVAGQQQERPPVEKGWHPRTILEWTKMEQERMDTVDNPEWIASHTEEERAIEMQALARRANQVIHGSMMPSKQKTMIPIGPGGQLVPAEPNASYIDKANKVIYTTDSKGETSVHNLPADNVDTFAPDWTLEQTEAAFRKTNPDYDELRAKGYRFYLDRRGEVQRIDPQVPKQPTPKAPLTYAEARKRADDELSGRKTESGTPILSSPRELHERALEILDEQGTYDAKMQQLEQRAEARFKQESRPETPQFIAKMTSLRGKITGPEYQQLADELLAVYGSKDNVPADVWSLFFELGKPWRKPAPAGKILGRRPATPEEIPLGTTP